jgi:transcriptional regulator with PAS, ATPase and Fis domain
VRVLLEGQSGTGKEMIARAIHQFSSRSKAPFVAIDCGAIPANLVESELFGHVKGAFTGAAADRKGLISEADNGTLFMDEIANLPIDVQAKLMRVLQEGEVRLVGSNKTHKVDVRVIAASSSSLRKLVEANTFREDLYYRLHVYPVLVPSLQERAEDIPILANHFLAKFAKQQAKQAQAFHAEIIDFIQQRHWAGNIRELENLVERLVTLAGPKMAILDRDLLPPDLRKELKKFETGQHEADAVKPLQESLSEYEEQLLRQALIANNWNIAKTARALRIAEQTLRYKMGNLGIVRSKT